MNRTPRTLHPVLTFSASGLHLITHRLSQVTIEVERLKFKAGHMAPIHGLGAQRPNIGLRPVRVTGMSGHPEAGTMKSLTTLFFCGLYK
jgi:hypothetical protein